MVKGAPLSLSVFRFFSSKTTHPRKVVVCSNGAVASWHPPQQFPFEHSRALPVAQSEETATKSVLSGAVRSSAKLPSGPNNAQLKDIFYTDKNEWYTRSREERLHSVSTPFPKRK